MKYIFNFLFLFAAICLCAENKTFQLLSSRSGMPIVSLRVLSHDPCVNTARADFIELIRHATIAAEYNYTRGARVLNLGIAGNGTSRLADQAMLRNELTREKLGDEGFLLDYADKKNYILCAFTGKGVLNGVYKIFEKSLGIAAPRPAAGLNFPDRYLASKAIPLPYSEKPAFGVRGYSFSCQNSSKPETSAFQWMARNLLNITSVSLDSYADIGYSLAPYGFLHLVGGHAFGFWIPAREYAKTHPEYFSLVDGKRDSRSRGSQLALGDQAVIDVLVRKMLAYIKANPDVRTIPFGYNDSGKGGFGWGNDPLSVKLDSPKDKIDLPGFPVSHSTRYIKAANRIIREVNKVYPDMTMHVWAYHWEMMPAPDCEVDPHLIVEFAPLYKCCIHALNDPNCPRNSMLDRFVREWAAKTKNIIFRDYFLGSTDAYPIMPLEILRRDLNYFKSLGFLGAKPETIADYPDGANTAGIPYAPSLEDPDFYRYFGDSNALLMFAFARLTWNPEEKIDDIITLYCNSYYGKKAAPAMIKYHTAWQKRFFDGGHSGVPSPQKIKLGPFQYSGSYCFGWNWAMTIHHFSRRFFDTEDPVKVGPLAMPLLEILYEAMGAARSTMDKEVVSRVYADFRQFERILLCSGYEIRHDRKLRNKPEFSKRPGERSLR